MSFKITTLCENTVPMGSRCLGEHGFSVLIEAENLTLLFDTGSGETILHNAKVLGKDLRRINYIVLSHGHYDHTGGLKHFTEQGGNFTIIAHPDIFANKYGKLPGESARYIGIPISQEVIEKRHTLRLSSNPVTICESIITTGEIPIQTPYEDIDTMLYVKTDGKDLPDTLADDLALILRTGEGLVVVLGCAHRGLINTLLRIRELTGTDNVHTVIGGLHLENASLERIEKTVESLRKMKIQKFGVSHCTGFSATRTLFSVFGEKVFLNRVGTVLEI